MNAHFDNPLHSLTKQTLINLSLCNLVQVINKPTHKCGHIVDWEVVWSDDDIYKKSTVTDSLKSDHYCIKSYFNVCFFKPSIMYMTVKNIINIDCPSFIIHHFRVFTGWKANQFCDFLNTVLNKHTLPPPWEARNHNPSPSQKPSHTPNIHLSSRTTPLFNRPAHSMATLGDRSFSFLFFLTGTLFKMITDVLHHCISFLSCLKT